MTTDTLLLIGRETDTASAVLETHADRLTRRGVADSVATVTYSTDPGRAFGDRLGEITAARVYAMAISIAHDHDTTATIPAGLSAIPGEVQYCEPLGRSPAITDVIEERAAGLVEPATDASLVLVGFGSASKPYQRQTVEYHAARLREESGYGEVLTCYYLQNPTVECVRYSISNPHAVAVPVFATATEATETRIPDELELDRGGMVYADPFGDHPRVTDAIHAELEKQRVLAESGPTGFETRLTRTRHPVATDGEGR